MGLGNRGLKSTNTNANDTVGNNKPVQVRISLRTLLCVFVIV